MNVVRSEKHAVELAGRCLQQHSFPADVLLKVRLIPGNVLRAETGSDSGDIYKVTFKNKDEYSSAIVYAKPGQSRVFYQL